MLSLALLEELLLNDNEIVQVANVPGRSLVELSLANNQLGQPFEDPMPGGKNVPYCSGSFAFPSTEITSDKIIQRILEAVEVP